MLELLEVSPGDSVLDIGSGSGWTTALLADMVGRSGSVTGLEIVPELVAFGWKNLVKYVFPWARISQAEPGVPGIPGKTFDRILVSASAEEFPKSLLDQLVSGGVLVIPVGESVFRYRKGMDGSVTTEEFPGFVFVPLL
jgi:protein-L-isoaspartate(D-aspartate) O-methyltransferase